MISRINLFSLLAFSCLVGVATVRASHEPTHHSHEKLIAESLALRQELLSQGITEREATELFLALEKNDQEIALNDDAWWEILLAVGGFCVCFCCLAYVKTVNARNRAECADKGCDC